MLERFAQEQPLPTPAPPTQPTGPVDVHIDLSGLANLIWQQLLAHLSDIGAAIWQGVRDHLAEIGEAIWTPLVAWLEAALRGAVMAVWEATFGALGHFLGQLPPEWTYGLPAYRAIATDPLAVAVGGATLALVLLGLRTGLGALVGRDHVLTHITGRLIPAVFLVLAYPALIGRGITLLNAAAGAVGQQAAISTLVEFPQAPAVVGGQLAFVVLWLVLLYYALRLLLRMAYSLFRFLVALVFGPVAIILWAIPQTEWVTSLWLNELLGWGTTPLLVAACLALALPLATGRSGFLAAAAFGIAGLQAAYDLVGLLSFGSARPGRLFPIPHVSLRGVAGALSGGGGGAAAASVPPIRSQLLADQFGFD
jgi:hypothetical protein